MIKNISNLGNILSKQNQKTINGGASQCFKYCNSQGQYIFLCPPNWNPVNMGICP